MLLLEVLVAVLNVSTTELFNKASKVDVPVLVAKLKAACDRDCVKLIRKGFVVVVEKFLAAGRFIFGNPLVVVLEKSPLKVTPKLEY